MYFCYYNDGSVLVVASIIGLITAKNCSLCQKKKKDQVDFNQSYRCGNRFRMVALCFAPIIYRINFFNFANCKFFSETQLIREELLADALHCCPKLSTGFSSTQIELVYYSILLQCISYSTHI